MSRELLIQPLNTRLKKKQIEKLGKEVVPAFRGFYTRAVMLEPTFVGEHYQAGSILLPDVVTGTYTTMECVPGRGIYPLLSQDFGREHVLVLTDMLLNFAGQRAGGTADKNLMKAIATTYDIVRETYATGEKLMERLRGVVLHELGHLFGLEHHEKEVGAQGFCPMINRDWQYLQYSDGLMFERYLDSRATKFCNGCSARIDSVSNGIE